MQQQYRVYIGAASTPSEIERSRRCAASLRARDIEVTSTWIDVIASNGGIGNPRDAEPGQRREWSRVDLDEVSRSNALWLLCPPGGVITRGAWVELGYASAHGKLIVASGDTGQSIFTALGEEFVNDDTAVSYLFKVSRGPVTP